MSETDIYKNREAMPVGNKPPKKKRRRRAASQRAFDDRTRKRRSKNSGLRRTLHLFRKNENEKVIWVSFGVLFVAILTIIAIWQFLISEKLVRDKETKEEYIKYQPRIYDVTEGESTRRSEPLID